MDHRHTKSMESKWITAADLRGHRVPVVIDHCELDVKVGDDIKNVLFFRGKDKGLVLNITNENTIADAYGWEDDHWIGQPLILYPTTTQFQGKSTPCLRVEVPPKASVDRTPQLAPAPAVAPADPPADYGVPSDSGNPEDVPF